MCKKCFMFSLNNKKPSICLTPLIIKMRNKQIFCVEKNHNYQLKNSIYTYIKNKFFFI